MYKFSILAYIALTVASPTGFIRSDDNPPEPSLIAATIQAAAPTTVATGTEGQAPWSSAAAEAAIPASEPAGFPAACTEQLMTQKVTVTKPIGHNGIRLDGVPPACMDVARSILDGRAGIADGPAPDSIDADSIAYENLSDHDYAFLSDVFDAWTVSQNNLIKRSLESRADT